MAAQAAVVFDGGVPGRFDALSVTRAISADDFVLAQRSRITDAHFWATERGTWAGTLEWFIYADAGSAPARSPLYAGSGANIERVATGQAVEGLPEFAYRFDLDRQVVLPAGLRYWFALHLPGVSDNDDVFWEFTDVGFGSPAHSFVSHAGAWLPMDGQLGPRRQQLAFHLTGSAVPEPATAALLALGLAGLAAARRRRR